MSILVASLNAQQQRDLAVAWMNRGHELMLQGSHDAFVAALDAYNEAIARLRPVIFSGEPVNPAWVTALGAALMNRGHLLHRLHGVAQATVALAAFDEAVAALRPLVAAMPDSPNPWLLRNLAGTLLNRANLLLDLDRAPEAASTAREALDLVSSQERNDLVDADLSLKIRRTLCDATGRLIVAPGANQDALASEASDLVDEALAVARYWADRETAFTPLALRFFRYGAQLYRLHQPHFLAEFIRENLAFGDPEVRAIAMEAIDAALADRPRDQPFLTVGDPASERHLNTARELRELRASLAG